MVTWRYQIKPKAYRSTIWQKKTEKQTKKLLLVTPANYLSKTMANQSIGNHPHVCSPCCEGLVKVIVELSCRTSI